MERQHFNFPHEAALSALSADRGNPDRALSRILTQLIGKPIAAAEDRDVRLVPPAATTEEFQVLQEPFGARQATHSAVTESTDNGDSAADAPTLDDYAEGGPPIDISEDVNAAARSESAGDLPQQECDDDPTASVDFHETDRSEATESRTIDAGDEPLDPDFSIEAGGSASNPIGAAETESSDEPDFYLGERADGDEPSQPGNDDVSADSLPGAPDSQELSEADRTAEIPASEPANISLSLSTELTAEASQEQLDRIAGSIESLARAAAYDLFDRQQQDSMMASAMRRAAIGDI
jgi:hypothetical protein